MALFIAIAMLDYPQILIPAHQLMGFLMPFGALRFGRHSRARWLVSAGLLISASMGSLQQASGQQSGNNSGNSGNNANLGVPQIPASQAAIGTARQDKGQKSTDLDSQDATKGPAEPLAVTNLGPGDLIEVNVYNVPELMTKARVSSSGDVYLPLIDYVHVDGLTIEEAQALIQKRLEDGGFVRGPHVTIFVDEAASQGVTLLGEVSRPGIYPDTADRKLYEVISEAGGFTASASRKIAIIRRNQPDVIRIDLPRNLADDLSGNIDIQPGDTITIPRAPIIYVVGDVGRPSGLLVDNGTLTVLQALALAGGTNRTASVNGARLIRKSPAGMTETKIQLKKMLEAKTPDVTLQSDDILFVPVSGGRVLGSAVFNSAMAAATAVTIYSIHP
jgi:polysaccharide export outer membrane protein